MGYACLLSEGSRLSLKIEPLGLLDIIEIQKIIINEIWTTYFSDPGAPSWGFADEPTTPSPLNVTLVNTTVLPFDWSVSGLEKVRYAYVTIGSLTLIAVVLFAVAYFRSRVKGHDGSTGIFSPLISSTDSTDRKSKESNIDDKATDKSETHTETRSEDTSIGKESRRRDRCFEFFLTSFQAQFLKLSQANEETIQLRWFYWKLRSFSTTFCERN